MSRRDLGVVNQKSHGSGRVIAVGSQCSSCAMNKIGVMAASPFRIDETERPRQECHLKVSQLRLSPLGPRTSERTAPTPYPDLIERLPLLRRLLDQPRESRIVPIHSQLYGA
jgi:hypothetical protein